jgi:DNA-binding NarL/FixJ family response regulator
MSGCRGQAAGMRARQLRGERPRTRTAREVDVLAAFVEAGGSVSRAAARVGIRPSTVKRHLADLRARSGLTTEQLIYRGRAEGWLVIPSLETEQKLDPRSVRQATVCYGLDEGGPVDSLGQGHDDSLGSGRCAIPARWT